MPISSRRAPGLDPQPGGPVRLPPGRARAALVRDPAGGRDPARDPDHAPPAGPARLGSGPGRRGRRVGGAVRHRGRAAVPRGHRLVGLLGQPREDPAHPGGRPGDLRRAARRCARRGLRRAPGRRSAARGARLRGSRRRARAGARPLRQLLQPGALRWADEPAVGPRDRSAEPAAAVPRRRHVPPDVPLRVALEPARDGHSVPCRPALAAPGGGIHARAVPGAVFARALLRRGPARRSGPRDRAVAAQPGGRRRRLRVSLAALARLRKRPPQPQA